MATVDTPNTDAERARLAALRRYAMVDSAPEHEFDELAGRTARECGYPIAVLTFMEAERCWIKAAAGLDAAERAVREVPRCETFCNYALVSSGILIVPDARLDARFRKLKFVNRPAGFRAYAGAQLITPDGHSIGTLCALAKEPRQPSPAQLAALRRCASEAMAMIEQRRARRAEAPPAGTGDAVPRAPRSAVLIVDDEIVVRQLVEYYLGGRGAKVFVAGDGAEALALYRRHAAEIGVVLSDINMPVMDGFKLFAALGAEPAPPALVAMTGRLDQAMGLRLTELGVVRALAKPFTLGEIGQVMALVQA